MEGHPVYDNPLPTCLILTAIVVAVSTTAVALAIIIRIHKAFGTVEEDKIMDILELND
jgi:multicomponent Na+:H+ antiporter subunit C